MWLFWIFVFLFLDFLYLSLSSKYTKKALNIRKINYLALFLCYVFLLSGYYYFIALPNKSATYAFVLGFFIYGVYETTNWSIIQNWPVWLVIVDTLWGGILFYLTTIISRHFTKVIKKI